MSDEQYRPLLRRYGFPPSHWAIIKDYLPNPIQLSDVPEIIRKKEIARRALIYNPHNSDILPRNFRGSFMVDLGSTLTYPYPLYWSNWGFENAYETYDKWVTGFEPDDETGEIVIPGYNRLKRNGKEKG